MPQIKIDRNTAKAMERRLNKLATYGEVNAKELRSANRKVAREYVKTARGMIQDASDTFKVYRNGKVAYEVEPGTLRRSMGTWRPKGGGNAMMAGPRAATRSFKRVSPGGKNDGFFAAWVEAGVTGKRDGKTHYNGKNKGVFERAKRQAAPRMASKQIEEYRKSFGRFVRKL